MKKNTGKAAIGTGLLGAAIGASLVTLLHKPTRKKFKEKATSFLNEADKKIDKLDSKASKKIKNLKENARDKLANSLEDAKKKVEKEKRS